MGPSRSRVLCFWALVVGLVKAQECMKGPVWLFSLPDDLESIYQGLTGEYGRKLNGVANLVS